MSLPGDTMDVNEVLPEDSGNRVGTCCKMPSKRLDREGVLLKNKNERLKNERSGYLSTVSSKRNEIDAGPVMKRGKHSAFKGEIARLSGCCWIFKTKQALIDVRNNLIASSHEWATCGTGYKSDVRKGRGEETLRLNSQIILNT